MPAGVVGLAVGRSVKSSIVRDRRPQALPMQVILERDLEVLAHRERLEDARHLELDRDAAPDALERPQAA